MIEQIGIAICGVASVFLSQDHRQSWRKWACIFGICGQPFWLYATWQAGQWGIFFLAFIYTASWTRGFYNNWLRPAPPVTTECHTDHPMRAWDRTCPACTVELESRN